MLTSKDIAQLAGVSVATVSRALHSPEKVKDETRRMILDIVEKHGYSPNYLARGLQTSKSNTVGIIVSDFQNPFYMVVAEILSLALKKANYRLIVAFNNDDKDSEQESISMLLSSRVEGLIFTPQRVAPRLPDIMLQNKVYAMQIYSNIYPSLDSLVINDSYGTYLAARHLLEHGHRRILLILGAQDREVIHLESTAVPPAPTYRPRGFRKAFEDMEASLPEVPLIRVRVFDRPEEQIKEAIRKYKPTAIIPIGPLSIPTMTALQQLNLSVPEDISLVIYDDQQWAPLMGVTVVGHPMQQIGSRIAQMMLDNMRNEDALSGINHDALDPHLVIRKSVRNI